MEGLEAVFIGNPISGSIKGGTPQSKAQTQRKLNKLKEAVTTAGHMAYEEVPLFGEAKLVAEGDVGGAALSIIPGAAVIKYVGKLIRKGRRARRLAKAARKFNDENKLDLNSFKSGGPLEEAGFSGVFDPESGNMLLRPSGNTKKLDGSTPDNIVERYTGHNTINDELADISGSDPSKTYAFTLLRDQDGSFRINYNSASVNSANHNGVRNAAISESDRITNTLSSTYNIKINQ